MTATVLQFPFRPTARVVSIAAARQEISAEIRDRVVDTLRQAGTAARRGDKTAQDLLVTYTKLENEPAIAGFAKRVLASIEDRVCAPCDVEPDGAA